MGYAYQSKSLDRGGLVHVQLDPIALHASESSHFGAYPVIAGIQEEKRVLAGGIGQRGKRHASVDVGQLDCGPCNYQRGRVGDGPSK